MGRSGPDGGAERMELARDMRRNGMTLDQIARSVNASKSTVYQWCLGIRKPMTVKTARNKAFTFRLGAWGSMNDDAMRVVAKEIIGDETVIACMARLVVAMSKEKEEPE